MNVLITSDLHLTSNPRDEDRWNLFPWMETQVTKYRVKHVLILGDITDAKDKHEAFLVNTLTRNLNSLSNLCKVIIIAGNHDGIDISKPFFKFTTLIPGIRFISKPTELDLPEKCLFLPCTRDYKKDWQELDFRKYDYIFCHQSFDGCIVENGTKLRGIPPSIFKKTTATIYSGDIHVPQSLRKNLHYVGSPYIIKFGDTFTPRLLLLQDKGKTSDLHFPYKRKELITFDKGNTWPELPTGTQVKIRVKLKRKEYPDWPSIRERIKADIAERKWDLQGLELIPIKHRPAEAEEVETMKPHEVVSDYAKRHKLDKETTDIGLGFLK